MDKELAELIAATYPRNYTLRISNLLRSYTTMAELLALTPRQVLRYNFGRRSLEILEQELAKRGLHFGGAPPRPLERDWWRDTLNELT